MDYALKPWYAARWETVEPEENFAEENPVYDDPSENELLDYEDRYGTPHFDWQTI
ncbi:hypothetical protein [Kosakonia phage Kc304]|nr:hypothetical protein [Kosakonia phage Kc304]UJJ22060.1 hypothetical protein [Erwinia phage Virsaitis27]